MNQPTQNDLADTVGTDIGRPALLKQIIAKVDQPVGGASNDDLDQWWGLVEIDRLASGLTLATIARLSEPADDGDITGPWLQKSDDSGDAPTQLTADGREAVRRFRDARNTAKT